MKICFITNELFSLGGAQRVLSVLANNLVQDYEVHIAWTSNNPTIDRSLYDLNPKIRLHNNRNLYSKKPINKILRGLNKVTGIFNKEIFEFTFKEIAYPKKLREEYINYINNNNYDLVIGVGGYFSLILGMISDKVKAKTIGWQHNSYEAYLENRYRYYWNEDILFEKYIPKLDRYIVLNNHDKEKFKKEKNIECQVIYNPRSFDSKEKSKVNKKQFLAAGRFNHQKGFDLLIESFNTFSKTNDDWKLVIVGEGKEKLKLIEKVNKYKLGDRIIFENFTNNIKEYFLNSSVLLLPSRWEGMPMIVLESLEMGVPVISYDITAVEPLITNGKEGIIVKSFDKDEFAIAMEKIVSSFNLIKDMSKECVIKSREFDVENIRDKWIELIDELAEVKQYYE